MYRVLLVDDERYVRLSIRKSVHWEEEGYEVCGEADGVDSALELIDELSPDLVITDMVMPDATGLALLESVRRRHPAIRFIILSGYDDFAYVRGAIRHGAIDYLLKPVDPDLLVQALQSARRAFEQARKLATVTSQVKSENLALKQELFLNSLFKDFSPALEDPHQELKKLEIDLEENASYVVLQLSADDTSRAASEIGWELFHFIIRNISAEILQESGFPAHFINDGRQIAALVTMPLTSTTEELLESCRKIIRSVNQVITCHLTIGVGSKVDDLRCIAESYRIAERSLAMHSLFGTDQVHYALSVPSISMLSRSEEMLLLQYAKRLDEVSIRQQIDQINQRLQKVSANLDLIRITYYKVFSILMQMSYDHGINWPNLVESESRIFEQINQAIHPDRLGQLIIEYCSMFFESIRNVSRTKPDTIEKAKEYICQHLSEVLTLHDISEYVFCSPNYLCTRFKQETGLSLFEFITKKRLEIGCKMLREDNMPAYLIGEKVGYPDPKYFTKVFKSNFGLTPSEYRRLNQATANSDFEK